MVLYTYTIQGEWLLPQARKNWHRSCGFPPPQSPSFCRGEIADSMKYATRLSTERPTAARVATKRLSQEVLALRDSTTLSSIVVPRQRRGKSLMRRRYQQRHVFQKGRQRSEKWASDEPAYVRFWKDIPGQPDSKRTYVPLGVCRTRTIAERKAAEELERLGINSNQHFIEALLPSPSTSRESGG